MQSLNNYINESKQDGYDHINSMCMDYLGTESKDWKKGYTQGLIDVIDCIKNGYSLDFFKKRDSAEIAEIVHKLLMK